MFRKERLNAYTIVNNYLVTKQVRKLFLEYLKHKRNNNWTLESIMCLEKTYEHMIEQTLYKWGMQDFDTFQDCASAASQNSFSDDPMDVGYETDSMDLTS